MIDPTTVRYDNQLAASICCTDIGGLKTVPIALGESFCPGQPVSLDEDGNAIAGTSNFVGLAESQDPGVNVVYVSLGGNACAGIPVFGDGEEIFAGKELAPTGAFTLTDLGQPTGNVEAGDYEYVVTFLQTNCNGTFESEPSLLKSINIPTVLGHSVQIDDIPLGVYADTTSRNIYRKYTPPVVITEVDVAFGVPVVASSEEVGFEATNVNNDDVSEFWINNTALPISSNTATITFDLGSVQIIDRWVLTWYFPGFASNDYVIESSNDNIVWTQEGPNYTAGHGATGVNSVTFAAPVSARYFRFVFAAGSGEDSIYLAIAEINLFSSSAAPPISTQYQLVDTIPDNTTTTYIDIKDQAALINQQPPLVSTIQNSLTNVSQLNFPVGIYDLGTGCITIPLGEEGCVALNCLKSPADMTEDEFAVQIDPCSWNMFDVTLDNPAIPRQLKHWDARGTSRKVRRLITFEGSIVHGGESGKLKGINALNGVWRTAATPTIKKDGFYLLEWIGSDGEKYSTQAQLFGSKPIIDFGNCSKFYTKYTVELVSEGEIFVGDEIKQIVEEGHIAGMDIGRGAVSISQTGLSDIENPTIVDLTSFCNRDSEVPMNVHISWTGLQDQAELPPNTGDRALGTYLTNYIIFANADTGTSIKFNVNFKRTDTIDIDKNGIVFYNGVENATIVDSVISIPPTLISGEINTLVLSDASYWGEKAHGKLIQAEISYTPVL